MDKKRILIVDDDVRICDTLKTMIESSPDYSVLCAHDGKKGLSMIKKEKPDAVILDVVMPGLTGFEVMAKIAGRYMPPYIPTIILTGYDNKEFLNESMYWYAEEFLTKPCSKTKMMATLKRVLSLHAKTTRKER